LLGGFIINKHDQTHAGWRHKTSLNPPLQGMWYHPRVKTGLTSFSGITPVFANGGLSRGHSLGKANADLVTGAEAKWQRRMT
jgi:hypothetical protein